MGIEDGICPSFRRGAGQWLASTQSFVLCVALFLPSAMFGIERYREKGRSSVNTTQGVAMYNEERRARWKFEMQLEANASKLSLYVTSQNISKELSRKHHHILYTKASDCWVQKIGIFGFEKGLRNAHAMPERTNLYLPKVSSTPSPHAQNLLKGH